MMRAGLARRILALCSLLGAVCGACSEERYFGPYQLQVPTELQERTAGRTFSLPLDKGDQRVLDNLRYCQEHNPNREIPCRCDYKVLSVGEQELRIDYRLEHLAGAPSNVTVWLGKTAEADAPDPALLPDRPRLQVWLVHLHRIGPGEVVHDVFSEDELRQAEIDFSLDRFPECEDGPDHRPAPLSWEIGLSTAEDDEASVAMDITCRVRQESTQ